MTRSKTLRLIILIISVFLATSYITTAQNSIPINEPDYTLPKAFSSAPDTSLVSIDSLINVLNKQAGEKVRFTLGNGFYIDGILESVISKYNGTIKKATVRLSATDNLLFTFSSTNTSQGNIIFRGFIMGKKVADCYELIQKDLQYYFIKKIIHQLRAE